MHHVALRPGPERGGVPAQILGHLLDRQHRAIGDVTGQSDRIAARELFADFRADAVAADNGVGFKHRAGLGADLRPVGGVLVADNTLLVDERDAVVCPTGIEQHAVQIGTVDDRVGIAEAPAERFVDRNFSDLRAGHAIHHDQAVDVDRLGAPGIADTEVIHRMKSIWPDLDAGADFTELVGLFEHRDVAALVGKSQRRREPANAAAGDNHRWSLVHFEPPFGLGCPASKRGDQTEAGATPL